jgi:hypothetical protein
MILRRRTTGGFLLAAWIGEIAWAAGFRSTRFLAAGFRRVEVDLGFLTTPRRVGLAVTRRVTLRTRVLALVPICTFCVC